AWLETIERVSRGLAREVDGLLQLARGEVTPPRPAEPVDLVAVAEEAVLAAGALCAARQVACRLTRDGAVRVQGDRAGLLRLASNLIGNAILYTEARTTVDVEVGTRQGE